MSVQGQGGDWFQPAGILEYVEDLKPVSNAEIEPTGIFRLSFPEGWIEDNQRAEHLEPPDKHV
jgi:hypothetical protein